MQSVGEDSKPGRRNDAFWPVFILFAGYCLAHPSVLQHGCSIVAVWLPVSYYNAN